MPFKNEVCSGKRHGAAQPCGLRGVFATAGTELLTRSFYVGTLLRSRVLPPSGFAALLAFELAIAWPKLTANVASGLFDSAWGRRS